MRIAADQLVIGRLRRSVSALWSRLKTPNAESAPSGIEAPTCV